MRKRPERNERRKDFVRWYVELGDHQAAARKAGYPEKHIAVEACRLRKELKAEIAEAMQERMSDAAPSALKHLQFLMVNSNSESVQLNAAKDLLDRSGYKPVERHEDVTPQKSHAELVAELESLVGPEKAALLLGTTIPKQDEEEDKEVLVKKGNMDVPSDSEYLN